MYGIVEMLIEITVFVACCLTMEGDWCSVFGNCGGICQEASNYLFVMTGKWNHISKLMEIYSAFLYRRQFSLDIWFLQIFHFFSISFGSGKRFILFVFYILHFKEPSFCPISWQHEIYICMRLYSRFSRFICVIDPFSDFCKKRLAMRDFVKNCMIICR